jgi:class 3 adenylate cyclase
MERRLAAILAADMVGYSRLTEQDEAGTLTVLKKRYQDILWTLVDTHRGRIVKMMGDGVLVEFGSAVNAVACATVLQERMRAANEGLPDDRLIMLRIGINLGDVIVEDGDLYGEGIIIAVRLQAMAAPGGICISGSVHQQIENKLSLAFEDLGFCEIKNSAKPVRVFQVEIEGQRADHQAVSKSPPSKPSVAVLPFIDMSGDPEQQYFSDGITEDIIIELGRFRELSIIGRASSFAYRGNEADPQMIK